MKKKRIVIITIPLVLIIGFVIYANNSSEDTDNQTQTQVQPQPQTAIQQKDNSQSANQKATFNKKQHSLTKPNSPWVIVNKKRGIPIDYKPEIIVPNVRLRLARSSQQMQISDTITANIQAMFAKASQDGVTLVFGSGYRSGALQQQFYNSYVTKDGRQAADTYSARPGHSEHQTGLAFDVTSPNQTCHLEICFADTKQGRWVKSNAHQYGFIIRYQQNKQAITGYQYEPWHLRYVGKELATEVYKAQLTLEEFFGLSPASNYD